MVAKLSGLPHIRDPPLENNLREMADWPHESDQDSDMFDAWTADERQPQGLQFTPKVALAFDGRIAWFAYEEAIDDGLDITTVTP